MHFFLKKIYIYKKFAYPKKKPYLCTVKEITTYQACKILQQKQLANLAMNSVYWSTRFDYLTIYEYMLAHYPERQRGYRSEIANSLSFSKLGGVFGTC